MKPILIASDHAGFALKEKLKSYLAEKGFPVKDLGTNSAGRCDYPRYAAAVATLIARGRYARGILICKSGIGNSIVANRFCGVRAALCYNQSAARLSREHNDSNILVLPAAFVDTGLAKRIARVWFSSRFLAGRHARRLRQIKALEKEAGSLR
jgi:ribose 5-phosphate isomerase B